MQLWIQWWDIVKQLRPCFTRQTTFLWFSLLLIGLSTRVDMAGITSIIRSLGLDQLYYDRLLDFFHSTGIKIDLLPGRWTQIILKLNLSHKVNGRLIILGDGIKAPKEGKKMPAVKSLHQESESNSKPEYIMGHSCQALSLLMTNALYFFAVPMICQIHEGIVESNRDQRTLMDKMISMLTGLQITVPFYLVADAYYSNRKIIRGLLMYGQHLISRVRKNAVAYSLVEGAKDKRPGRPKVYGKKIKLRDIFKLPKSEMSEVTMAIYNDTPATIAYKYLDLMWRPVGVVVRFVFVMHPEKGNVILMSTDLTLAPVEILKIYALRFKIEVSFKQAVNTVGAYAYHFWMIAMDKIKRKSSHQYLHRKTPHYREQVKRKMAAYHIHIQAGLIAQGLLQILSMTSSQLVWRNFGSWIRTIRPGVLPSEQIVMSALRNTLPEFLKGSSTEANIEKFILDKVDLGRAEGQRMVA